MSPKLKLCCWYALTGAILTVVIWGGHAAATRIVALARGGVFSTVISIAQGNPKLPGCTTSVTGEGALTAATYRITQSKCKTQTISFVFYMPPNLPFAMPIYTGNGADPVPQQVRQRDATTIEIVFAKPGKDGSDRLLVKLDTNGMPIVDHAGKNKKSDTKTS